MNFRKNKGNIGIDVSIAFTILLITIPVVTGIIISINKINSNISRKTQALNIAINCMEEFKSYENKDISNLDKTKFETALKNNPKIGMSSENIIEKQDIQYKVNVDLKNIIESDNYNKKEATATVTYKSGGKVQEVKLKTSLKYYV